MYKVIKNENKKEMALLTMSNGENTLEVVRTRDNCLVFVSPNGSPIIGIPEEVIKETAKAIGIKIIPDEPVMQIKYIGMREKQKDALYGTGWWNKGQIKKVSFSTALKMLKHKDIFISMTDQGVDVVMSPNDNVEIVVIPETKFEPKEETLTQDLRDTVTTMDKNQLRQFVAINFAGYKLPTNIGLENARAKTIQMIDLYGVPT